MKLLLVATLATSAAAFAPSAFSTRQSTSCNANLQETIAALQGSEIYWGSEGIAAGFEEVDIKGYEQFGLFAEALTANGVDITTGEHTVLAPSDGAIEKHIKEVGTPIDADILKYHIIPGTKTLDGLTSDQETLNGKTLTAYRKFRKNWLDNAVIGLKSEGASKSGNMPADVAADNGMIHGVDSVLVPGAYTGSR